MTAPATDPQVLNRIYELAARIRLCDERVIKMLTGGEMAIIYYPVTGQEVLAAASGAVLRADDYVVTTYRGMHDQVAKGMPFGPLFAEYMGRVSGACKGKGGPMHITYPELGIMVTSGIVGGGLPIANGLGWAAQLLGQDRVTVVNFGDGAANIGAFHEALNLAALWDLPVVFLCQNNRYAEHTSYARSQRNEQVAPRAEGYGMAGVTVDGNDAAAIYSVLAEAVAKARRGEGPTLVEAMTYRFNGHYFGDPQEYMPTEEKKAAKAADPVKALRRKLIDEGHANEEDLAALEARIRAELDEAVAAAKAAPMPDLAELYTDVYAEELAS
ncbi:thiamine pyrophosphate-dependent dehydrogenase E1 component subunit alpha [Sporichthya sp.]|uniref:thiamine pyrophosphate-dependent dehydrogenase E1 component subunit alpha n=1 Tax=Sporichthya sp. TaxID=65475 RepID=UPI00180645EE|nr:thiamine pyrophosphate-dependent dehydrogenase E1 component subunit alpha [Sporichthya sp.]MBA3743128.1 thiamine pyrophosphate-dependent dehydrogenase E1 component subunit alpha [Sporichthya sp.]